jgi:hypothetical protein
MLSPNPKLLNPPFFCIASSGIEKNQVIDLALTKSPKSQFKSKLTTKVIFNYEKSIL